MSGGENQGGCPHGTGDAGGYTVPGGCGLGRVRGHGAVGYHTDKGPLNIAHHIVVLDAVPGILVRAGGNGEELHHHAPVQLHQGRAAGAGFLADVYLTVGHHARSSADHCGGQVSGCILGSLLTGERTEIVPVHIACVGTVSCGRIRRTDLIPGHALICHSLCIGAYRINGQTKPV